MIARTALITLLVSTLVACDSSPIVTEPAPSATPTVTPESSQALPTATAIAHAPTTAPVATPTVAPTATPSGMAEIPPCTPVPDSHVNPCETSSDFIGISNQNRALVFDQTYPPDSVENLIEGPSGLFVTHLVIRGTFLPGTVRCSSGYDFRLPTFAQQSWPDSLTIMCYADVRVNEYLLGAGPSVLTVVVARQIYSEGRSYVHAYFDPEGGDTLRVAFERALTEGGRFEYGKNWYGGLAVEGPAGGIAGREAILFIGPNLNTYVESWRILQTWDIHQRDDGTVVALHPYRFDYHNSAGDPLFELELPAFRQAVEAAQQARVTANAGRIRLSPEFPMLVTDANQLRQHYVAIGAYSHPGGPPAQPPPVLTCDSGTAVANPNTNRGLVHDCSSLLGAKDALRGTAALNWSVDGAIGSWDGITTSGTLTRVTRVALPSKSLSGTIPMELGQLVYLTHLNLSSNSLTGSIPDELGLLTNLQELWLSGNSLTGCIPVALQDVATNDLSSLNLLYCAPPAPENLSAGTTTEANVALSWDAVANASKYRVEYRLRSARDWTVDDETLTTTSRAVDELECDSIYRFRVSAYGSGTTYAAAWSEPSATLSEVTGECTAPVFDEESYSFTVMEDVGTGTEVDTVSATDPNDDALTYAITAGNAAGTFAIGPSTGTITVAGPLNRTTTPLHTLTVQADDGNGNTGTVTVVIGAT